MGKTVGNTFFAGIVCGVLCTFALVATQLEVTTLDGDPIKQAGVGQPFKVTVTVDGKGDTRRRPRLTGLDGGVVQQSGIFFKSVNGVATTTYTYMVRLDTPGSYTVEVSVDAHDSVTATATIVVGAQEQSKKKDAQNHAHETHIFARLLTDTDRVVVGQKVQCALRVYADKKGRIARVVEPELRGWNKRGQAQQSHGTEVIDGHEYVYVQWLQTLVPAQDGELVIPAYRVEFERSEHEHSPAFGLFSSLLSLHVQPQRLYSNALSFTVAPLPPHDGPVHVVGSLTECDVSLEPTQASVGEGIVLKLRCEGDADFERFNTCALEGMPEGVRWYASKQYMTEPQYTGPQAKLYEYIVQGIEPGEYEVPAQSITVFDTESWSYKTLQTDPVTFHFAAAPTSRSMQLSADEDTDEHDVSRSIDAADAVVTETQLAPLNEGGAWYPVSRRVLPLWLFFLLASVPLIAGVALWIKKRFNSRRTTRQAARDACHELALLESAGRVDRVYTIVLRFFAEYARVDAGGVDHSIMVRVLSRAGYTSQEIAAWQAFFERVQEECFGQTQMCHGEKKQIVRSARVWIADIARRL